MLPRPRDGVLARRDVGTAPPVRRNARQLVARGLALVLAMLGMPAVPQSVGTLDLTRAIELPAQPLGEALRGLAKQANLQILFDAALVAGRSSRAIEGNLTARTALAELLRDTALEAYEQAPGVVVIRRRDGVQRGGDADAPPNPQED